MFKVACRSSLQLCYLRFPRFGLPIFTWVYSSSKSADMFSSVCFLEKNHKILLKKGQDYNVLLFYPFMALCFFNCFFRMYIIAVYPKILPSIVYLENGFWYDWALLGGYFYLQEQYWSKTWMQQESSYFIFQLQY